MDEEWTRRTGATEGQEPEKVQVAEDFGTDGNAVAEPLAPNPAASTSQPVSYVSLGLTIGDGFKFGCGLTLAVTIALLIGLVVASVIFLLASLIGVPVPLGQS